MTPGQQKKFDTHISRMEASLAALKGIVASQKMPVSPAKAPAKRVGGGMSPEGRARVAEAQRKRWAKQKRAAKKAARAAA